MISLVDSSPIQHVITEPIVIDESYPHIENLIVYVDERSPGIQDAEAAVLIRNPISIHTRNLTIESYVVGLPALKHVVDEDGRPPDNWKEYTGGWPSYTGLRNPRDSTSREEMRLWRDSLSSHTRLRVRTLGSGLVLENRVSTDEPGSFCNHTRLIDCHIWNSAKFKWVKSWLSGERSDVWQDHFSPDPLLDVREGWDSVELEMTHLDCLPHLGVRLAEGTKLRWRCGGSEPEPIVNWKRYEGWGLNAPPWIIGGPGVKTPEFDGPDYAAAVRAGGFVAYNWPPYLRDYGELLFEER